MQLPIHDSELAEIAAYLTCDGTLAKDLKGVMFCSTEESLLAHFEGLIAKKFATKTYREAGQYPGVWRIWSFSRPMCRFLQQAGVPAGNKTMSPFRIPDWIKADPEVAIAYLKVAFACEGSWYVDLNKQGVRDRPRVRFRMHKWDQIVGTGVAFMDDLRALLEREGVTCTNVWLSRGTPLRKDGRTTLSTTFDIRARSLTRFVSRVGFGRSIKNDRASNYLASRGMGLRPEHQAVG